jgi:hypothetical protein
MPAERHVRSVGAERLGPRDSSSAKEGDMKHTGILRVVVAVIVVGVAIGAPTVAQTKPPITPDAHCSPVAQPPDPEPGTQVRAYGGVYCPGGSSHAIGFNIILLECTTTSLSSCVQIDSKGWNFSTGVIEDYTLRYGNTKPCNGSMWYRSRSRITVTLATATSAAYDIC